MRYTTQNRPPKFIFTRTDLLHDERIEYFLTLTRGKEIVFFFYSLLLLSADCNRNGGLWIKENIPYTISHLAQLFSMSEKDAKEFMDLLDEHGFIADIDGVFTLINWENYYRYPRPAF